MVRAADDSWGDDWYWQAIYEDGTFVDEYDEHGKARGFLSVSQAGLKHLVLVSQREGLPTHVMTRDSQVERLHFFRRRQISTSLDTGEETRLPVVHIIGLERDAVAHYTFFFEDGSVLVSDDLNAV